MEDYRGVGVLVIEDCIGIGGFCGVRGYSPQSWRIKWTRKREAANR